MDGSGTINPAALNASAAAPSIAPNLLTQQSPRGTKRERSPDDYGGFVAGGEGNGADLKPRKRGKPTRPNQNAAMATQYMPSAPPLAVQTPQVNKTQVAPQVSPTQTSPQRTTPSSGSKSATVKALPTVRDHTTDQLGPDGDEYIPREVDEAGEKKVSQIGAPLDGREYRIRTFTVPNRGDKLFMLATECARILGYRDSYLLFNKNRSLYKIIASQAEKDNLIHQEILPYSYRSRQIAIVTARSMFRQFGSRVIVNGRRVRDDYWESKARKQGFTEEDAAGEKRPGAAKQREAAAAEASNNANAALAALPTHGEIIYTNQPGIEGPPVPPGLHPVTLAPLPMIMPTEDMRNRDYGNIPRPRQEISGPPYQDRSQPSNPAEIIGQATQANEFNKGLTQQRAVRAKYYEDYWKRPHEPPTPPPTAAEAESGTVAPQNLHSPQQTTNMASLNQNLMAHTQSQQHLIGPQTFPPHPPHQQNPMQSPIRSMHQQLPGPQMHQGSPAMSMASMSGRQQTPSYGFPGGQMFPPPQPQPSPMSQIHHMSQYAQQHTPQPQHQQPSMHPPSQLGGMGFGGMNPMATMNNPTLANLNRNMYQPSPNPQHFGMGQSNPNQQGGMPGWAPPSSMSQDWQQRF